MGRRRVLTYYLILTTLVISLYYYIGIGDYINTLNIEDEFHYPLDVDIKPLIEDMKAGREPSIAPINVYPYNFMTTIDKCRGKPVDLLILVKSAMEHFDLRTAIRDTWGKENNLMDETVRVLFFLGVTDESNSALQKKVDQEITFYNDIVQIDFIDAYYNNTIKTMMAFRWAYDHCDEARYYLFSDDDMYISVANLLDYTNFHERSAYSVYDDATKANTVDTDKSKALFAGFVFKSRPHRYLGSKWRVSLDEYPWNKWPPYVSAGAYVVSNNVLKTLYLGSMFVKHFRFDDIYLGIVAKKAGVTPVMCEEFYFYKKSHPMTSYKKVIASHGFDDPKELITVWRHWN